MSEAAARLVRFDKAKVRKHAEVSVPRPVAEPPFPDAQLAYHNNSKVGLNAARRERRGPPGVAARYAALLAGRMRTTRTSSR